METLKKRGVGGAEALRRRFFEALIRQWLDGEPRKHQIAGEKYYRGAHAILERQRTVIGRDGRPETIVNVPNNRIIDNQYARAVDQKVNYLLGKPFNVQTANKRYEAALKGVFDKSFQRLLQNVGEDSLNCGIGWLYAYYDEDGAFGFKRFAPWEVLPLWKDAEHTALDCAVRVYEDEGVWEGGGALVLKTVRRAELYLASGVERYLLSESGALIPEKESASVDYVVGGDGGEGYAWDRIPIVPFKYNNKEIPLIRKVKTLQDAINATLSDFQNNMQEDARNTILIVTNYDGENLADFRYNLAAYGAVKVKTVDGAAGSVGTLKVEVNAENYKTVLQLLKKALVENAMAFDAKELNSGTPNQMNIMSMYNDIDLDANGIETEWRASFESLLYFVNAHLANAGKGDFAGESVEVVFNRDMMMNESDVIANVRNSVGILSTETVVANHPWADDLQCELGRLEAERREGLEYQGALRQGRRPDGGDAE
jgi:SPP1 family phage portal protein